MRRIIYWFSGAGNSKLVATHLASCLGQCQLVRLETNQGTLVRSEPADQVGLVFPAYYGGPPPLVARFIREQLVLAPNCYLFIVVTHGGFPAYTVPLTERFLAEASIQASFIATVKMVDTYIPLYKIPSAEKQQRLTKRALTEVDYLGQQIKEEALAVKRHLPFSGLFLRWWQSFLPKLERLDQSFVVTDACNYCQWCVQFCPVENISIEAKKITFLNHCQQCFGCYHGCPQQAISLKRRPPRGYTYYHQHEVDGDYATFQSSPNS